MKLKPAEVFPPGEFIKEELEDRGWSQDDLAEVIGRSPKLVSELVSGRCSITTETAVALSGAFGTSPELWLNLQNTYSLWMVKQSTVVARKAQLFKLGPVREMAKRGWIEWSDSIDVLETRVTKFFETDSADEEPRRWGHAARMSADYGVVTPHQRAWLYRARHAAKVPIRARYSQQGWSACIASLRGLMGSVQDVQRVPETLSAAGIRFVVIEKLSSGSIDGVCTWLDEHSPVIALSLRYNRIDWFWHVLLHEMVHVRNQDGLKTDALPDVWDLKRSSNDKPESEAKIEVEAAALAIPSEKLNNFIARVSPLFSKLKIAAFAETQGVHPGIVVGQLQYMEQIGWHHNREMLVPVRDILLPSAIADGWGHQVRLE